MTTPDHFDVVYVINPHMAGRAGTVDLARAGAQWALLGAAYASLGIPVHTLSGREGLPDMVFCANQTLPFVPPHTGRKTVVLGRMHAPERRAEVPFFRAFFETQGYEVLPLPSHVRAFEGMGDALWHPGRALLWGGYGFRTDPAAYTFLSDAWQVPTLLLCLTDPYFYHLDTCLSLLDERTALFYPGAFDADGLDLLRHCFDILIEAPETEARRHFACNAHCPDQKHVLIHEACTLTCDRLRAAGFEPITVDTSEFLKAGGSVYCMKQMFF